MNNEQRYAQLCAELGHLHMVKQKVEADIGLKVQQIAKLALTLVAVDEHVPTTPAHAL